MYRHTTECPTADQGMAFELSEKHTGSGGESDSFRITSTSETEYYAMLRTIFTILRVDSIPLPVFSVRDVKRRDDTRPPELHRHRLGGRRSEQIFRVGANPLLRRKGMGARRPDMWLPCPPPEQSKHYGLSALFIGGRLRITLCAFVRRVSMRSVKFLTISCFLQRLESPVSNELPMAEGNVRAN